MSQSLNDILRCFSETSVEALRFMETRYGCGRTEGFSTFDGVTGTLRASDCSRVPGIFSYVVRYVDAEATLEVTYGDRELLVDASVFYPAYRLCFNPLDLLSAAGVEGVDERSFGDGWVHSLDHMRRVILNLATSLEQYWSVLRCARPEVMDRASILVEERMLRYRAEQRRRDRERACILASEAFHSRRYAQAIELLAPYLNDPELSAATRMLHGFAVKYDRRVVP